MIAALLLTLFAQASSDTVDVTGFRYPTTKSVVPDRYQTTIGPAPTEKDRLSLCLEQASKDPSTAIQTANLWFAEADGAERANPQQCLGMAYAQQQRWENAEQAFLAARTAMAVENSLDRARLAAMAGNSALADGRYDNALADLGMASVDASNAQDTMLGGDLEVDRSRALVALGRAGEAGAALERARRDAPQNADGWLLSATFARRDGDLATAQTYISTAAGLDPKNPQIGLEAGVISALGGNDDAARKSFQSVVTIAPGTPEAETAKGYLAQLAAPADKAAE